MGKTGEEAKDRILQDKPNANVQILPEGSMVTKDYRTDRVRVFVDEENRVASVPRVGWEPWFCNSLLF